MARPKLVKITKDGQEGQALESAVAAWERHGWTRVDESIPADEPEPTPKKRVSKKTSSSIESKNE